MRERQREVAIAIKNCLDNLAEDAARSSMQELAHFIGIAAMAAEDAARASAAPEHMFEELMSTGPVGHC